MEINSRISSITVGGQELLKLNASDGGDFSTAWRRQFHFNIHKNEKCERIDGVGQTTMRFYEDLVILEAIPDVSSDFSYWTDSNGKKTYENPLILNITPYEKFGFDNNIRGFDITAVCDNTYYNVTYHKNIEGEQGTKKSQNIAKNGKYEISSASNVFPEITDRIFKEWKDDYGNTFESGEEIIIIGNLNISAQWITEITVTFDGNGATSGPNPSSRKIRYNDKYSVSDIKVTRNGYSLIGWFTQTDGGQQITDETVMDKQTNHTIYAQWSKNVSPTTNYRWVLYATGVQSAFRKYSVNLTAAGYTLCSHSSRPTALKQWSFTKNGENYQIYISAKA